MNFKDTYCDEIKSVGLSESFCKNTAELMREAAHRKEKKSVNRKTFKVITVTAIILVLASFSAYAVYHYLSPKEVAEKTGNEEAALLFENSEVEAREITCGEYTVTLHGIASSDEAKRIEGADVEEGRSYIVVSVARSDGAPIYSADGVPVQISPLVAGFDVWKVNLWTLEGGANGLENDGVIYYLFSTKNISIFADHTVYIAAYEGFIPTEAIFTMLSDGTIVYNESYTGFRGMFEIEFDDSEADPEAVERLLENI